MLCLLRIPMPCCVAPHSDTRNEVRFRRQRLMRNADAEARNPSRKGIKTKKTETRAHPKPLSLETLSIDVRRSQFARIPKTPFLKRKAFDPSRRQTPRLSVSTRVKPTVNSMLVSHTRHFLAVATEPVKPNPRHSTRWLELPGPTCFPSHLDDHPSPKGRHWRSRWLPMTDPAGFRFQHHCRHHCHVLNTPD